MKKQVVYIAAALITASCLLFSSSAQDTTAKEKGADPAGVVKHNSMTMPTAPEPGKGCTSFPGVIHIEL